MCHPVPQSPQDLHAQFTQQAASPAQSPSVVVTPPRLNAAGYGDEVPSPSPVAWPDTEGRTFGRDATPSSAMGSLQIELPPPTSFSNLSHPLTSPPASPLTSPAVASLPAGDPVVRQLMTPTAEEAQFTFSSTTQHCSPLRTGKRDATAEDATPFARDGWDAAVRQQQQLREAADTTEGMASRDDAIRAAGFGWGEHTQGAQADSKRKASAPNDLAPFKSTLPKASRRAYWLPTTLVVLLAVVAPLPHRQLLINTSAHALHRVAAALEAPTRAVADHTGAWATAAQQQATAWKRQAWEYGDLVRTVGSHGE